MSRGANSLSSYKKKFADVQTKDDDIKEISDYDHVYTAPDMYMDSTHRMSRVVFLLSEDGIETKKVDIPYAFERVLMVEFLANGCDAATKTVKSGFKVRPIIVTMTEDTISIRNGGIPIPVRKNENGVWHPQHCFSKLKTGTSFNKRREGGGRNGMGATLGMMFSECFVVNVKDSVECLEYEQTWNGPYDVSEPIIVPYDETLLEFDTKEETQEYLDTLEDYSGSFVTVTYKPDFSRFGYNKNEEFFTEDMIDLFRRNLADTSFGCKTDVHFNDEILSYKSIVDYGNIFFDSDAKRIVHYVWPSGTKIRVNDDLSEEAEDGLTLPDIEVMLVDCHRKATHIGLANCVFNGDGGIHVSGALNDITKTILQLVNGSASNKEESSLRIQPKDVRSSVGVIVSVRVLNPSFNGQPKSILRAYCVASEDSEGNEVITMMNRLKISIPKEKLKSVESWDCVNYFKQEAEFRLLKILTATDGNSGPRCGKLHSGTDAKWAGTKNSGEAILLIFEGKSAGLYGKHYRDFLGKNGHNILGLLPTGGKIKNMCGMNIDDKAKLAKNYFFLDFKQMMGIKEGVDYTIPENYKLLRYKRIHFAGDSDIDGTHIKGLFSNMLHVFYPSILIAGVLKDYKSKLVTAEKGKKKLIFYELSSLKQWQKENSSKGWKFHYFKGLGSSDRNEIKEDFDRNFVVDMNYDDEAAGCFEVFFEPNQAATRRELILDHDEESVPPEIIDYEQDISSFLQYELIKYCTHTLIRHLPKRDGLNEVRRKVLHSAIKVGGYNVNGNPSETRTSVFSNKVVDITYYHHGESLSGVCTKVSQSYVGSVNLPTLKGHGQFGSRAEGGKDAASVRYTHVAPYNKVNAINYKEEDKILLEYLHEEGNDIEPVIYYPPVPMVLVQGIDAVMSGWRVYVPPHNYIDVCMYMLDLINEIEPQPLTPWWRGFKGYCKIKDNRKMKILHEDEQEVVDDDGNIERTEVKIVTGKNVVITRGIIEDIKFDAKNGVNSFTITELPPGVWTETYIENLEKMKKTVNVRRKVNDEEETGESKRPKIQSFENISTVEHPRFKIQGFKVLDKDGYPREMTEKDFPLERKFNLGSMMTLGDDNKPIAFESTHDMAVDYLEWRLVHMERWKVLKLNQMEADKVYCEDKIKYINAVIDGDLVLVKGNGESRLRKDCLADIERLKLNPKLYGAFKFYDSESVEDLKRECNKFLKKYRTIKEMTAKELLQKSIDESIDMYVNVYTNDSRLH